jgi:signal recognition particle receptor subunit beta
LPLFNVPKREISCKIVYYGPGLSGKTTNLEVIHKKAPAGSRGDLTSIATEGDRTLFFDYMNLDLGKVGGMKTKFQLYTVPGQPYYNATRKLVLQGVDGIVFVADSQADMMDSNVESLRNLEENLREMSLEPDQVPLVIQWNKRDLPDVLPVEELERKLNRRGVPTEEAVAVTGDGVLPTLKTVAKLVLEKLNKDFHQSAPPKSDTRRPRPAPEPAPRPTPPPPARPVVTPPPEPEPEPEPAASFTRTPVNRPSTTRRTPTPASEPVERPAPGVAPAKSSLRRKLLIGALALLGALAIAFAWDVAGLQELASRLFGR